MAEFLGHLPGIGAGLLGGFLVIDANVDGAEGLDFFLGGGTNVRARDNAAEAARGGDGRAGGTVPAAVIIIGKPRAKALAASMRAR